MSWRRPVAICVLAIMVALPVSGVVCTILCHAALSSPDLAAGHYHGANGDAKPAGTGNEDQVRSISERDCSGHDAAVLQTSTTAAERADSGVTLAPLLTGPASEMLNDLAGLGPLVQRISPPGTAPPTTTPLVLRV